MSGNRLKRNAIFTWGRWLAPPAGQACSRGSVSRTTAETPGSPLGRPRRRLTRLGRTYSPFRQKKVQGHRPEHGKSPCTSHHHCPRDLVLAWLPDGGPFWPDRGRGTAAKNMATDSFRSL